MRVYKVTEIRVFLLFFLISSLPWFALPFSLFLSLSLPLSFISSFYLKRLMRYFKYSILSMTLVIHSTSSFTALDGSFLKSLQYVFNNLFRRIIIWYSRSHLKQLLRYAECSKNFTPHPTTITIAFKLLTVRMSKIADLHVYFIYIFFLDIFSEISCT